jgi:phospholipase C
VDSVFTRKVLPPFTYTTYPERLQAAGVSWQVYQQGTSPADDYEGNYGTNVLGNFKTFIEAPEGSALHARGMSKRTLEDLAGDVKAGQLPQVSWLLPPAAYSEHPRWAPGYGATYIARVLDALTANPEVWARTVLFIMYDENDGYFDHVPPPQPPTPALPGKSTVSVAGEVHDVVNPLNAGAYHVDNLPYGLGPRVPMMAISPWSKGGFVCSEVFDHTSVLRFLERRFGVAEPNITAWRRAVCGDLTSAFDFAAPNARPARLPDTSGYIRRVDESCRLVAPSVPAQSAAADIGAQEPGTRPARPLPYDFAVEELVDPAGFSFRISNNGAAGASFYVYREHSADVPRRYTVGAGASVEDVWALDGGAGGRFSLMGPNGFVRRYALAPPAPVIVSTIHQGPNEAIVLQLSNPTGASIEAHIRDNAYGAAPRTVTVGPGHAPRLVWPLTDSHGWYDLSVTLPARPDFDRRLAGHVETGRPSTSDPAASTAKAQFDLV